MKIPNNPGVTLPAKRASQSSHLQVHDRVDDSISHGVLSLKKEEAVVKIPIKDYSKMYGIKKTPISPTKKKFLRLMNAEKQWKPKIDDLEMHIKRVSALENLTLDEIMGYQKGYFHNELSPSNAFQEQRRIGLRGSILSLEKAMKKRLDASLGHTVNNSGDQSMCNSMSSVKFAHVSAPLSQKSPEKNDTK